MKEIIVRSSAGPLIAKVDDEDFPIVSAYSWKLSNRGYAMAKTYSGRVNGKSRWLYYSMHRLILNDAQHIDHINHDCLDNRRSNLRSVTIAQNAQNKKTDRRCTSGYRGVTWDKHAKKWKAKAMLNGRTHNLGYYETAHQASEAVCLWRSQHMPFSSDAQGHAKSLEV